MNAVAEKTTFAARLPPVIRAAPYLCGDSSGPSGAVHKWLYFSVQPHDMRIRSFLRARTST